MGKKKNNSSKILYFVATVLAIASICMIFVAAAGVQTTALSITTSEYYTGLQVVFGDSDSGLVFSFMNLLPYILVLAALVLVVLKLCGVLKSRIFDFVAAALLIVGGVFYFLTANFVVFDDLTNAIIEVGISAGTTSKILGVGSIIAGITSILSGFVVFANSAKK